MISHTGDLVQSMAQSWLVFQMTHSAMKLGWLGFCQLLPRLLFSAVGGVIVDRVDRRRLLVWTQTVAMLQSMVLFALVATHAVAYWHVVALALLLGTADTLHLTARHALIPLLVPPVECQRAVAINSAGMNLTQVIGPSLGGVLLGFVGVAGCLLVNVISFVAILIALVVMRWRPPPFDRRRDDGMVGELAEGIAYVRARQQLWIPIAMAWCIAALAMSYSRLLPLFASDVLKGGERTYGLLLAAPGAGAVLASLAIARRGRRGGLRLLRTSTLALVIALVMFALSRSLAVSLLALAVVGGAQMMFRTTAIATLHAGTDDAHRGRVIALFLIDYGLWSFGTLLQGFVGELASPSVAVASGALACLAGVAGVGWVSRRRGATMEDPWSERDAFGESLPRSSSSSR